MVIAVPIIPRYAAIRRAFRRPRYTNLPANAAPIISVRVALDPIILSWIVADSPVQLNLALRAGVIWSV